MYVGPWQEYQLMKVIGDLHDQRARNCEHTGELVCPSNTCNSSHRHSPLDPTAQSNLLNPSNDKEEDCAISYARGGAAVAHGLVYSAYNNNRRNDNNGDDSIDGASTSGDRNPNAYRSPPSTTSWRIAGLSPRQTLQAAVRLRAMQPRCSVRVNAEALGERASQCACRRVLLGHPKNADGVGSGSSRRADASVSLAEAAGAQRKRREQMCALYCVGGDGVAPVGEDAGGRGAESVWTLGNIEDSTCGRANRSDSVNEPDCSGGGNMLGSHALISGGVGCGMHNSAHSSQPRLSLNDAHYPDRSEIQMEALLGATARAMATTATSPATYSSVLSSSLYSRAEGKEEGVPWDDMIPTTRRVASIAHASGVQSLDQASENNPRRTTKTDETDSLVVVVNALGEGDGGAAVGGGAYAADVAMDDISALLTWAEDLNIDAIDAM